MFVRNLTNQAIPFSFIANQTFCKIDFAAKSWALGSLINSQFRFVDAESPNQIFANLIVTANLSIAEKLH